MGEDQVLADEADLLVAFQNIIVSVTRAVFPVFFNIINYGFFGLGKN